MVRGDPASQDQDKAKRQEAAFRPKALTGYDVSMWQMNCKLPRYDGAFALGFTSYRAMMAWQNRQAQSPIDPVRDLLIRLYMVEPSFPIHFQPPPMQRLIDFLFNLNSSNVQTVEEARKRCASLLAVLLGKNRSSGYRWARASMSAQSAQAPVLKLCSKVFSMDPKVARRVFWNAASAMAEARGMSMEAIREVLIANGVVGIKK